MFFIGKELNLNGCEKLSILPDVDKIEALLLLVFASAWRSSR